MRSLFLFRRCKLTLHVFLFPSIPYTCFSILSSLLSKLCMYFSFPACSSAQQKTSRPKWTKTTKTLHTHTHLKINSFYQNTRETFRHALQPRPYPHITQELNVKTQLSKPVGPDTKQTFRVHVRPEQVAVQRIPSMLNEMNESEPKRSVFSQESSLHKMPFIIHGTMS